MAKINQALTDWLMSTTATSSRVVNSRKASSIFPCGVSVEGWWGGRDLESP